MFSRAGARRRLIGEGAQHSSSVAFASSRQGSAEIQLVSLLNPFQAALWICSLRRGCQWRASHKLGIGSYSC